MFGLCTYACVCELEVSRRMRKKVNNWEAYTLQWLPQCLCRPMLIVMSMMYRYMQNSNIICMKTVISSNKTYAHVKADSLSQYFIPDRHQRVTQTNQYIATAFRPFHLPVCGQLQREWDHSYIGVQCAGLYIHMYVFHWCIVWMFNTSGGISMCTCMCIEFRVRHGVMCSLV